MKLPRLALVIGTESTGASETMLRAADKRVYLPLHGFADSLNLSVAAALLVQRLLFIDPSVVGDMSQQERQQLRRGWYERIARNDAERERNAKAADDFANNPVRPFEDLRRPNKHRAGWVQAKIRKRNEQNGWKDGIGTM